MNAQLGRTADRAFSVLSALSRGPASVTELSRSLEINRTIVARLLSTFVAHGLIDQIDRQYQLAMSIRDLAAGVDSELRSHLASPMMNLVEAAPGIVLVSVRTGVHSMVLTYSASMRAPSLSIKIDLAARTPLEASASGQAMLAFSPQHLLKKWKGDGSLREPLDRTLERIREHGIAVLDIGADLLPLREYAAPIIYAHGYADAAISLLCHQPDAPEERRIQSLVRAAGAAVSDSLQSIEGSTMRGCLHGESE